MKALVVSTYSLYLGFVSFRLFSNIATPETRSSKVVITMGLKMVILNRVYSMKRDIQPTPCKTEAQHLDQSWGCSELILSQQEGEITLHKIVVWIYPSLDLPILLTGVMHHPIIPRCLTLWCKNGGRPPIFTPQHRTPSIIQSLYLIFISGYSNQHINNMPILPQFVTTQSADR